jgi:ATP-dependent Clp protease ATP-binding subunit ClpC
MDLVKNKVKAIICLGLDNQKIIDTFSGVVETIVEAKSAMEAVAYGYRLASKDETVLLSKLADNLSGKVIGQEEAVLKVAKSIRRNRLGIKDPNKPIGSFIFLGSTGVGKTLLAKKLAKEMFGSEDNLIRVDMSEYQEKHTISRLIGAPSGYVGYEDGGQLTEQVKSRPYSVILFDEVEKAHKDIFSTLLQVLDEGHLTDSLGKKINFKNCVIIMTSNIGSKKLQDFGTGVGFKTINNSYAEEEHRRDVLKKELKNFFSPEFLNRVDEIVIFNALVKEDIKKIVTIELDVLSKRLIGLNYNITFDETVLNLISEVGFDETYGARPIKRAIQDKIEDFISEEIIKGNIIENGNYSLTSENNLVKILLPDNQNEIEEKPKKTRKKKKID